MKNIFTLVAIFIFAISAHAQVTGYSVGDVVDDFTVTDTEGVVHTLSEYTSAGKYVYIDFFYTTCGPCQAASPYFNGFYDKYGCNSGDVICLVINSGQDDNAAVIAFEETYGGDTHHAPAVSNEGGCVAVRSDFGIDYFPTFCLIGPDQKLKEADIWPINDIATFEATFPAGFEPQPMECSATDIESVEESNVLTSVYPNPTNGQCVLNYDFDTMKDYEVRVINMLGQDVYKQKINAERVELSLGDLHNGIYILEVIENGVPVADIKLQISK